MTYFAWPEPSILRKIADIDPEAPKRIADDFERIAAARTVEENRKISAALRKNGPKILLRSFIEGLTFQSPATAHSLNDAHAENQHALANDFRKALRRYIDENDWQLKLTRDEIYSLQIV